jgi:hypothetical protein
VGHGGSMASRYALIPSIVWGDDGHIVVCGHNLWSPTRRAASDKDHSE